MKELQQFYGRYAWEFTPLFGKGGQCLFLHPYAQV